jgi:hypothetical protein
VSGCQYHPPPLGKREATYRVSGSLGDGRPVVRRVCRDCLPDAIKMLLPKTPGKRMTVSLLGACP